MPARPQFLDRDDAGRQLGAAVQALGDERPAIVLALPRGGVSVGARVAQALDLPLDVYLVRKLGVPGNEQLTMGAIASGGTCVLNQSVLGALGIIPWTLQTVVHREIV